MSTNYTCGRCGRELEKGQFMAVIGQAPASGLSTPIGRADKIINDIGTIYCGQCFQLFDTEELVKRIAVSHNEFASNEQATAKN